MQLTMLPAAIIYTPATPESDMWCVYEHSIKASDPTAPPKVIYINACKLNDVFRMSEAHNNSEWARLTTFNPLIMIRITAVTTDRAEAMKEAQKQIRSHNPMPDCNLRGYNMFGRSNAILCSNGKEYPNQLEAANALGLSQSAISQQLRGKLKSVKGYTFSKKGNA